MTHPIPLGSAGSSKIHPLSWRDWARPSHSISSEPRTIGGAIIQRWAHSSRQMNQPPLDHHYIAVHLGGDKRITRSRRTQTLVRDVTDGGMSTIEAGSSYRWTTEGPIAFGHIYVDPSYFAQTIGEQFDCDPDKVRFEEEFGQFDPLLCHLLNALVHAVECDDLSLIQQEAQLEAALHRLYERQAALPARDQKMLIAPASVMRVKDYIGDNLTSQLSLDELARLSGYSRFHFARGFKTATGLPPYAYILRARVALACRLLEDRQLPVQAVASASGFASHPQFASRFRQFTGISPSAYRKIMR